MHRENFIPYQSDSDLGNCELCGSFYNLKTARLAGKLGSAKDISESVRDEDQEFRCEVPMDVILTKLVEDWHLLKPVYRPEAFYLSNREVFCEWMFDLAEKLRVQPETFHHSVNMFDAYLQKPGVT